MTVPDTPGAQCLVRVKKTDGEPSDISDGEFSIEPAPKLTVLSPDGAEVWVESETREITWTSEGTVGNVGIDYSVDGGITWKPIASGEANDGSYSWLVPPEDSTQCRMRVEEADGDPTDTSDLDFIIEYAPTLRVASPNGGETWFEGETQRIIWATAGLGGNVDIDYSIDNGGSWKPVASGESNDGSYDWTVPREDSAECLVRVQDPGGVPSDTSDATFTMAYASVRIVSPNGNEWWAFGETREITWVNEGTVGNVDIYYSTDGGTGWIPVASDIANTGSHSWDVPNIDSTTCLVRVEETDQDPTDDSNAVFTVTPTPPLFSDIDAGFAKVYESALAWGDYDNDGDLDLLIAGEAGPTEIDPNRFTRVYRNEGGEFSDIDAGLEAVRWCSVAWGDIDNDGDLDVVQTGVTYIGMAFSNVYRNNGGTFVTDPVFFGLGWASLDLADYDNDGDLDLTMCGELVATSSKYTCVLSNSGGTFGSSGISGIVHARHGVVQWGDYDGDGRLDLFVAGQDNSDLPASGLYHHGDPLVWPDKNGKYCVMGYKTPTGPFVPGIEARSFCDTCGLRVKLSPVKPKK